MKRPAGQHEISHLAAAGNSPAPGEGSSLSLWVGPQPSAEILDPPVLAPICHSPLCIGLGGLFASEIARTKSGYLSFSGTGDGGQASCVAVPDAHAHALLG
jgi:hypothetical protein